MRASKLMMNRPVSWILALGALLASPLLAQEPATPDPSTIKINVDRIAVPVTVMTRSGKTVNGLQPADFRLYDNNKQQNVSLDVTFHPVSIVIAVQANSDVEGILPKIQKIGSLLESVVGESGEVALIAFDHRIRVLQEFTPDTAKITEA